MKLSKADCVKYLKAYQGLDERLDSLRDSICALAPNSDKPIFDQHCFAIDMLGKIMGDEDKWICHYVYELEYGKKAEKYPLVVNGEKIILDSIDKLYELIKWAFLFLLYYGDKTCFYDSAVNEYALLHELYNKGKA